MRSKSCPCSGDGQAHCHENSQFAHEKSRTYERLAIFMLGGAPEAHEVSSQNARCVRPGREGRKVVAVQIAALQVVV